MWGLVVERVFFILTLMSGALGLAACQSTTGGSSGSSGNTTGGGGSVLAANFAKNVFLENNSNLVDRAAFLSDAASLDDFYQNFSLPSSGQVEIFDLWTGSTVDISDKYVVDFGAGTVTQYYTKPYTDVHSEKGKVLTFDRTTGEFTDQSSSGSMVHMTNVKTMFVPVLTGKASAVIKGSNFGWEILASDVTMPKNMPTSGNASYSGQGVFDVRQTDLDGRGWQIQSTRVEFQGVSTDAAATVDFAGRTYVLDITNFSGGPVGSMRINGEFSESEIATVYYPFGQTDGAKPGNFVIKDTNGNVLWTNPFSDATGDRDYLNFVGADGSEIIGELLTSFDTPNKSHRIQVDGAYVASKD